MPGNPEIDGLIGELKKMKAKGAFKTFIDYIVFPRYRNISPDTKIDFGFPLTVLVGQNGSGKSAVLQALYGAPGGYSVSRWWFETAVDPIIEPDNSEGARRRSADLPSDRRSSFWYGYKHQGEDRYVIKTRIKRANDPNYWEPSRPIANYGMKTLPEGKRFDTITMIPVYINFKLNINSFDKCFYFVSDLTLSNFGKSSGWKENFKANPKLIRSPRVQDYIRTKSRRLKRVIHTEEVLVHAGKFPLNESVRVLTDNEIASINQIIGKTYTAGKVVKHRFFEGWGITVAFSTNERSYTDAFAGSGEGAVVRLVLAIEDAEEGSLVLLDEPETSLHPGAQERMLAYLLDRIKRKQLQVVISTHSPTLVGYLPRQAIKVFSLNAQGNADVVPNCTAEEAFHYIGHRYDAKINVIVEDRLAKEVVEAAIKANGEAFAKRFSVSYGPGGESAIKRDMAVYSRGDKAPLILFDGDQIPLTLRLIPMVHEKHGIPQQGRDLAVVAVIDEKFQFRLFDAEGELVVEASQDEYPEKAAEIARLKEYLESMWTAKKHTKTQVYKFYEIFKTIVTPLSRFHLDTDRIAVGDRKPAHLMGLIEGQAGSKIDFAMDSHMSDDAKSDLFVRYLDYFRRSVYYLPFPTPEEVIWDDGACRSLLSASDPAGADAKATEISSLPDYKARFAALSEVTKSVEAVHHIFVSRFVHTNGDSWNQLVNLMKQIGETNA